jgi:hypothetical protein
MYLAGALLLFMTLILMISNLIADILLAWADPRHLSAEVEALVASADSPEFAAGLERFFARKRRPGAED